MHYLKVSGNYYNGFLQWFTRKFGPTIGLFCLLKIGVNSEIQRLQNLNWLISHAIEFSVHLLTRSYRRLIK